MSAGFISYLLFLLTCCAKYYIHIQHVSNDFETFNKVGTILFGDDHFWSPNTFLCGQRNQYEDKTTCLCLIECTYSFEFFFRFFLQMSLWPLCQHVDSLYRTVKINRPTFVITQS